MKHSELVKMLSYDPITGSFKWRCDHIDSTGRKSRVAGKQAGSIHRPTGRLRIGLLGKDYQASRLAWFYVTRKWPSGEIDHRDRNRLNNAFSNLLDLSGRLNHQNRTVAHGTSSTGLLGVIVDRRGRFCSRITVGGVAHHLGCFGSAEEAHLEYMKAKKTLHPGWAKNA